MLHDQLHRRLKATHLLTVLALGTSWLGLAAYDNGDWTTYRGNTGRTAHTATALPKDLRLRWHHEASPAAPAWPAPARRSYWQNLDTIEPRMVDDRDTHPVVAGACVLYGSSRQDEVVCLDSRNGEVRWRVVCDGPVRYAPVVVKSRVYFGSDDGAIRCVHLMTGKQIWSHRIGPQAPMIPGNGRIISPYPVRTGLLIEDQVIYACAGLFPMQGVFAAALHTKDGKRIWHRRLPDHSPQGYPLATAKSIIFPNSRANPFSLLKKDGSDGPSFPGVGGTFAVIADQHLVAGRGNDNTLASFESTNAAKFVNFPGKDLVVTPTLSVVIQNHAIVALHRARLNALRTEQKAVLKQRNKKSAARKQRLAAIAAEIEACALWNYTTKDEVLCAIAAGDTLYLGFKDRIERRSLSKGTRLSKLRSPGVVVSMAAGDRQLIATTRSGSVLCFGAAPAIKLDTSTARATTKLPGQNEKAAVRQWLTQLGSARGYALVLEPADLTLAATLLANSELHLLITHRDPAIVQNYRHLLRTNGVYGTRATVHHLAAEAKQLPYVSDFANLVVDLSQAGWSKAELHRLAAPSKGLVVRNGSSERVPRQPGTGEWTHQYASPGNTADSQDQHITSDLTLQWFGGPGPHRMIDRHLRGPPPLVANGRMFLVSENGLIGVDAYNGTEHWDLKLPDSQRYGMPYDAGYIACDDQRVLAAVDDRLWDIDANSGKVKRRIRLPSKVPSKLHWGFVAIHDGAVYGSSTQATAPRTVPGRNEIHLAYKSARPLVTSRDLFRMDSKTMKARWVRKRGAIINPTLTLAGKKIFFVESRNKNSVTHPSGRIDLATLLASDAWLVALHTDTGKLAWELPLTLPECRNIVYLTAVDDRLVLIGSRDDSRRDVRYHLRVLSVDKGSEIWRSGHGNLKPGQLSHGEQVHHPVVMNGLIIAEPFVYQLADGKKVNPNGSKTPWKIQRPGHSCGTMSGANGRLFFRANNPTVLDLTDDQRSQRFTTLAPSRAGCWINIIPACGLVLIPEASASCVCHYALQTSMAFRPR
jgi:outer membrane protein assembly factor BamB